MIPSAARQARRLAALQARLDARRKAKVSPGQLGLDLTGAGGAGGAGGGPGTGKACGQSHISRAKTCRKGAGTAAPARPAAAAGGAGAGPSGAEAATATAIDHQAFQAGMKARTVAGGKHQVDTDELYRTLSLMSGEDGEKGENVRKLIRYMMKAKTIVGIQMPRSEVFSDEDLDAMPKDIRKLKKKLAPILTDQHLAALEGTHQYGDAKKAKRLRDIRDGTGSYIAGIKKGIDYYVGYLAEQKARFERYKFEGEKEDDDWSIKHAKEYLAGARKKYRDAMDSDRSYLWSYYHDFYHNDERWLNGYTRNGTAEVWLVDSSNTRYYEPGPRISPTKIRRSTTSHLRKRSRESYDRLDERQKSWWAHDTHNVTGRENDERIGKHNRAERHLGTLIHEVGHQIHYAAGAPRNPQRELVNGDGQAGGSEENISRNLEGGWRPGVSTYARLNDYESFAESFTAYVLAPGELRASYPKTYEWVEETYQTAMASLSKDYANKGELLKASGD